MDVFTVLEDVSPLSLEETFWARGETSRTKRRVSSLAPSTPFRFYIFQREANVRKFSRRSKSIGSSWQSLELEVGSDTQMIQLIVLPSFLPLPRCVSYLCPSLEVENESNTLQDGSLIDLCGATLLWRTPAGLRHTPTLKQLESLRQELNAARPQCPVGFNTLAFPSLAQREIVDKKQPWVYVNCGHVHGYHNWGYRKEKGPAGPGGTAPASTGERECPMCRRVGPYVPLWLGCEGGLYLDAGPPTHAFCPCGHVCSEKTVVGWSQIPLPHGTHAFHAACPFCGTWLTGEQGHIKLIFQGPVD